MMLCTLLSAAFGATGYTAPRWSVTDLGFRADVPVDNPFAVTFGAAVETPDGRRFEQPGFYTGDGLWKLRLGPDVVGTWRVRTASDLAQLDGREATVTCTDPPVGHGGIRVDPEHPHHFVYDDGTRRYLLGYECDWLWALDLGRTHGQLPTLRPFLDKLAAHGFTEVLLQTYAHDHPGRHPGHYNEWDHGPPPLFAFGGSNDAPDHLRLNLDFWAHYDRVIAALNDRGLAAHLMIKVYNKRVNWPPPGSVEDDRFFRWVVARYAAYPNVVWDFSKEARNEQDLAYKLARLRLIRRLDPYGRLLTVHDDDAVYDAGDYDALLDFRTDQHHQDWHQKILQRRAQRNWPVFNSEFGYDHGPDGPTDRNPNRSQPTDEVVRRTWEVVTAGGYANYYYNYTAWDVIRPEDTPPGYAAMKALADFFAQVGYWRLEPDDSLIDRGHCLAALGQEYVAYVPDGQLFSLQVSAPLSGRWLRCLTGETQEAATVAAGRIELSPPAAWRGEPVALHLGAAPEGEE